MNTETQNAPFNPGLEYAELLTRKHAFRLAALIAFLMSSYFVVGYLAGNLQFWTWNLAQWMNGLVGIGITGTMTAYQFILYGRGDSKKATGMTILATCVAVGFSLLSEVGQGMERDHIRMETKSQQSPTYQAVINQIQEGAGAVQGHPYSARLESAEMKLARCVANRDAGKGGIWKDCTQSEARLKSVQAQIKDWYARAEQTTIGLVGTAQGMEKDDSNYHPLVNLVKGWFGVLPVTASFWVSFVLIAFFEFAFHYLGRAYAEQRALLTAHGYDITNKKRVMPRKADGTTYRPILSEPELKAEPQKKSELTEKQRQANREAWRKAFEARGLPHDDDPALWGDASESTINNILGKLPEPEPTKSKEPDEGNALPSNVSDLSQKRFFQLLYTDVRKKVLTGECEPTVRPVTNAVTDTVNSRAEKLGLKKDVFGKPQRQKLAETILMKLELEGVTERNQNAGIGLPKFVLADRYAKRLDSTRQLGIPSQSSDLDSDLAKVSNSLYPSWVDAIKQGAVTTAKAATQRFIWKHSVKPDDSEGLTANETAKIWQAWKKRGAEEGALLKNPAYKPGNRKPEYLPA